MKKISVYIVLLLFLSISACKKMEDRKLLKDYEGVYLVIRDSPFHCSGPDPPFVANVKKYKNGLNITGLIQFENFDVNYQDSTLFASHETNDVIANGKLHPNDSIEITVITDLSLSRVVWFRLKKID